MLISVGYFMLWMGSCATVTLDAVFPFSSVVLSQLLSLF